MKKITLVTGGCRSGKSAYALKIAEKAIPSGRRTFIATCVAGDDEMKDRVSRHRKERGENWTTAEIPVFLAEAITQIAVESDIILVDCITLWMNNLLMETEEPDRLYSQVKNLIDSLEHTICPVIIVTNEVGMGIVPENRLARFYRDLVGFTNQQLASCATDVIWMVSGIAVKIKGQVDHT